MVDARAVAERLLEVYKTRKLPRDKEYFRLAGFSKELLKQDPDKFFQLLIIAAHDRQPFTWWARGWEPIWEIASTGESLPRVLGELGLFRFQDVATLDGAEIERLLGEARFCGKRLDSYGGTNFVRTFHEAALLTPTLHSLITSARTTADVLTIHATIDGIHGFGPTIAAKIIMYTMRELGLGQVPPVAFAPVVRPLLDEYHNSQMAKEIDGRLGTGTVRMIFDTLCELGDPFAIDVLYYIDRDEPSLKPQLLS